MTITLLNPASVDTSFSCHYILSLGLMEGEITGRALSEEFALCDIIEPQSPEQVVIPKAARARLRRPHPYRTRAPSIKPRKLKKGEAEI
jgi:hypothetical protein